MTQEDPKKIDADVLNITLFAFWALVEALQILALVVFVFSFIPFKPNPFVATLFPLHQKGVLPEREMLFYRIFVMAAIGLQAAGLYIFRRRLTEEKLSRGIVALTLVNAFWLFIQVFAVFKIIVVGNPGWAKWVFYFGLAGAVACRVFWPEVRAWGQRFYEHVIGQPDTKLYVRIWDIVFPLIIVGLIFVPDLSKALARIFVRDQFYHLDSLLMAPGWAHLNGLVLNRDVISEYSILMPVAVSHIAQWLGGFNYHNVVVILIGVAMLYYIGLYFFLRQWLGGVVLASFGVLLAMKLQMFHWGVSPLIWQFPSATVIRYCFDLGALYCLWRHCSTDNRKFLWAAAVICGLALAYMFDTGIYLTATLYAYLVLLLAVPFLRRVSFTFPKDLWAAAALFLIPLLTGFILLGLVQGPSILSREFWANAFEFAALFLQGWGALPMFDSLRERQFFAFIMGFVIPVVYVWTMIVVGTMCFLQQISRRNMFVVILCVYGLGLYHYFINRSAVSSYYVVCIPFVCVVCFWIGHLVRVFGGNFQRLLKLGLLAGMFGALLTSYLFTYYPNALNLAGDTWSEEAKFYKEEFNFAQDASLISGLTSPDDRVALISSFETAILMEAKRKPFFYYTPLIESSHMRLAFFRGTYLHTIGRMQKTLNQLNTAKPAYVFIERKLYQRQIPPEFYQYYQTLTILVDYLAKDYTVAQEGKYLVALRRK